MAESLRARLLWLHTVAVTTIVVVVGAAVCYSFWRTLLSGVDRELLARAAVVGRALSPAGPARFNLDLPPDMREYFRPDAVDPAYYTIWTSACVVVDASEPDHAIPCPRHRGTATRGNSREAVIAGPQGALVLVGQDLADVHAEVRSLAFMIAPIGLGAVGLSLLSGWFLAGRALAPISRMSFTARAMADGDFDARVPIDSTESELGLLGVALNTAFEKLHAAIERQRRFTADASHDLRTPLAALRAEVDWALGRPRDAEAYREALVTCRTAAARMSVLVEALLALARAEAEEVPLQLQRTDLADVVEDAVALAAPMAAQRGIRIDADVEGVTVWADPERLREALSNVVWNAVQYSHDGGHVTVRAAMEGDRVTLRVIDTGVGIAADDLPHVFDRFYRADKARATVGGTGLGLSLTKRVVERHGGTVACASAPGSGTEVTVYLPSAR